MLARANRIVRADDYRRTIRHGRRLTMPNALIYIDHRSIDQPTRVGFIVSKAVGNAVTRNLMIRRLRSIARDFIHETPTGADIVVRALPGSSSVPWATLHGEILNGLERSASK